MRTEPKILIINDECIYKQNATGITLRSILKNWNAEDIRELHFWNASKTEDEGLKINSFRVPSETFPLNLLFRRITHASLAEESSGVDFGKGVSVNAIETKSIKLGIKEYIKYIAESYCIDIKHVIRILEDENFKPDIIYTFGGKFEVHNLVYLLSKYYACPVCVHYMDNWRETLFLNTPKILGLNKKNNASVRKIEARGEKSLVISPLMKKEYERKYHGKYEVLLNSIDQSLTGLKSKKGNSEVVSFVYAGGLHLNRYKSLLEVEEAIKNSGLKAKLIIYTSDENREKYESQYDEDITEFKDYLPHDMVCKIYEEADVLVHIESFAPEQMVYTKYSLSTKIPEYMHSSKPILCYAPKEISVSEYISSCNAGICVGDKTELEPGIAELINNSELRIKLGHNGHRIAMEKHNILYAQELLKRVFEENIQKKGV